MMKTAVQNGQKQSLSGLSEKDLITLASNLKWPSYKGKQLHTWIYKKNVSSINEMTDINLKDRNFLNENYKLSPLELELKQVSKDSTIKYLWKLQDGNLVESVRMFMEDHDSYSACISSQVGCAVGCPFCATGTIGLKRNLNATEIVDQILGIQRDTKERISNVVFMGQGEPLNNYDEVLKSVYLIKDSVGIGARHITVSTSGIVPGIKKLADEKLQITLAVSLHAPDQKIREFLVPISRKYKMPELIESLHYYCAKTKRRITIEYVMLEDINDQIENARSLADLLKGLHCHVNLIPYNPIEHEPGNRGKGEPVIEQFERTKMSKIYKFQEVLEKNSHKKVTIRRERGLDISGACGQLANKTGT